MAPGLRFGSVGLGRFERPTSRLSGVRSNQLSYRPIEDQEWGCPWVRPVSAFDVSARPEGRTLPLTRGSRKEVIQPQVPLRLPCYDFAPVTELAFGGSLPCGLGHRLRALPTPMA